MSADKKKQKQPEEPRRIKLKDWQEEGRKLFGEDERYWKFVCPNCKNVQSPNDFLELKELGVVTMIDPNSAYFCCIGRFDARIAIADIGEIGDGKSPCNYTMGGLFRFVHTIVIDEKEKEHFVFEFAPGEKEVKQDGDAVTE